MSEPGICPACGSDTPVQVRRRWIEDVWARDAALRIARGLPPRRGDLDRSGVYFVKCGRHIKIGKAYDVLKRFPQLFHQAPDANFEPIAWIPVPDTLVRTYSAVDLERKLHEHFAAERVIGEWFLDCPRLRTYIMRCAEPWPT